MSRECSCTHCYQYQNCLLISDNLYVVCVDLNSFSYQRICLQILLFLVWRRYLMSMTIQLSKNNRLRKRVLFLVFSFLSITITGTLACKNVAAVSICLRHMLSAEETTPWHSRKILMRETQTLNEVKLHYDPP